MIEGDLSPYKFLFAFLILATVIGIKAYTMKANARMNFVTRITSAEFDEQRKYYTQEQIRLLKQSVDYKFYQKVKGHDD